MGFDPAAALHAVQRGIKRALLHTQDVAGNLLNTFRNGPAVERLKRQGAEDEQVQRALRKINGSRWHPIPLLLLQEGTPAVVEVQGERRTEIGIPTALNFQALIQGINAVKPVGALLGRTPLNMSNQGRRSRGAVPVPGELIDRNLMR